MRAVRLMRFTVVPACLAVWILSGCGSKDNPVKPPDPPGLANPIRSSPQNVLLSLEIAYSHRDSVATKALYDSSYAGTSEDLNDPPGTIPYSFTYSDEVGHVAALARTATVSSVLLSFGPASSWTRLASNDPSHPEWAAIQIPGSNLDIQCTDGADTWMAGGSYLFFQFMFKPSTPESTSPTDTLWTIVRWNESRAAFP